MLPFSCCKNWIVEVFIKFQIPKRILHVSSHTVFKMDYLHNLDQMNAFTKFLCCTLLKVLFHARGYFQLIAPGLFAFHFCSFSISHFLSWVISCALLVDYLQKLRQVIMIGHETMLTKNPPKKFMGISSFDHFYCFTKYFYKY